jgi:hypothetical protein
VNPSTLSTSVSAAACRRRQPALLSTRRGYTFLPKQVFGVPTPDYIDATEARKTLHEVQERCGIEIPRWDDRTFCREQLRPRATALTA